MTAQIETLSERKADISAQTGIAVHKIGSVQVELETLRRRGVLVELTVTGIGIFQRTAKWDEYGIQADSGDPRLERMRPGQKCTLPVKDDVNELKSIQALMRSNLDDYSYSITGFKPYRWLPVTAYDAYVQRWNELKIRFYAVKDRIIRYLDGYADQLAGQARRDADLSWTQITALGHQTVIIDSVEYNHDAYIDAAVAREIAKLPSIERIEEELHADYRVALVYSPSDLEADRLIAEAAREKADAERQAAYLQTTILQEQVDHQNRMQRLEQEEKELKIEAIIRAEAAHARDQLTEIASPFAEVFTSLRRQIASDAAEMLDSIQKNNFVRGKVAEKGRGLLELFDLLAAHDDRELRTRLLDLRQAIGAVGEERTSAAPERNTQDVVNILEQIKELEHQAISDLLAGPSRFSMVE